MPATTIEKTVEVQPMSGAEFRRLTEGSFPPPPRYGSFVPTVEAAREVYRAIGWEPRGGRLLWDHTCNKEAPQGCLVGAWAYYLSGRDAALVTDEHAAVLLGGGVRVDVIEHGFDSGWDFALYENQHPEWGHSEGDQCGVPWISRTASRQHKEISQAAFHIGVALGKEVASGEWGYR